MYFRTHQLGFHTSGPQASYQGCMITGQWALLRPSDPPRDPPPRAHRCRRTSAICALLRPRDLPRDPPRNPPPHARTCSCTSGPPTTLSHGCAALEPRDPPPARRCRHTPVPPANYRKMMISGKCALHRPRDPPRDPPPRARRCMCTCGPRPPPPAAQPSRSTPARSCRTAGLWWWR